MTPSDGIAQLRRAARRAGRRARTAAVFRQIALLLPLPLGYAALALTLVKVLRLDATGQRLWWGLGVLPVLALLLGVGRVLFARHPAWQGSIALDQFHGLHDRVTSALSFSQVPAPERTPLMQAAIEDGAALAPKLDPRRAVPIGLPRELAVTALLLLGLGVLSQLEVRHLLPLPPPPAFEPMVMSADDIDLFRDVAKELQAKNDDPNALLAVRRFNQLVEDIAEHRLDRHEVFQRMGELERDLKGNLELDREARDDGLKGLARELEKSGLGKPTATALDEKRLADAEKALRELAEKLKKKEGRPSAAELDKLRRALEKASRTNQERTNGIEQRRRELEEERKSLLKKKNSATPDAGATPEQDKKLADNERRLEHLDRDKNRAERTQKEMSELDKQLAQAARDLMRDAGQSAQDLEQGAQDINRMAKQELSEQQKQQLLEKLQEMRELMRQQGKGGKDQRERMQRFGQRARGQSGSGQGNEGEGEVPGQGRQGSQKNGPLRFGNGPGSMPIEIPVPVAQQSAQGQGPSGADKPGGADPGSGPNYGNGHDDKLTGNATDLKGKTTDVTAAGVDTGQGAAASQVIYGAAERGFVGRGYKQVFTDYQTVAERALSQDEIPSGYRFYVRRYFQLIRPRE
ncbi:MAG TPA: hypothetical protein VFK05_30950 [Polyangiaceae bacterium]|nr:hypothetical protein [Polyangiaceae bacterium]